MNLIKKESAFKIFYYIIASDGIISAEETEKMDEIGLQLFGNDYGNFRDEIITECKKETDKIIDEPDKAYEILSEYVRTALDDTTVFPDRGIPSRMLIWNLLTLAYSDGDFDQNERRLLERIIRKQKIRESIIFEMEQYIRTVQAIDEELENLKFSTASYETIRPIVDELENRREIIKQAVIDLINDEMVTEVKKLVVQDDVIDKAQAAIRGNKFVKKANEQTEKIFGDVKKAAAPVAAEAGKKLGKAFMSFGSKLMGKQSSDKDEE
ncbi:MAG: TerB family tellurite resistance protein [Anaerolineaceae bacterium]|nr:TerB family tellurite resistance protein [Anaerolineaceae bacterium]